MTPSALFHSAPTFETPRLRLRGHRADDLPEVSKLWRDPRVTRFVGNPQTAEESWGRLLRYAGHWALLGFGYWAVEEKATGSFIGEVGLANHRRMMLPSLDGSPELGWVVSPESAGRGYATEAAMGALAWGQSNWESTRVVCIMHPDHQASMNIALKCGFHRSTDAEYKGSQVAVLERWLEKS